MQEIPPAKSSDAEDVVWGLQTAETLWRRGERIDALVWLRRAAQAAGDANDDDRALELARYAAELSDWMATLPPGRMSEAPARMPPNDATATYVPTGDPDGALPSFPLGSERPPPPTDLVRDLVRGRTAPPPLHAPPPHAPPSSPTMETAMPSFDDTREEPLSLRDAAVSVLPAEKVHAGMFDPWAESPEKPKVRSAPPLYDDTDGDEVITSVKPAPSSVSAKAPPMPPAPKVPRPPPLPPRARAAGAPAATRPPRPSASKPAPPPASIPVSVEVEIEMGKPAPAPSVATSAPPSEDVIVVSKDAVSIPPDAIDHDAETPHVPLAAAVPREVTTPHALDLEEVEAFADLPDDARAAFAAAAEVHQLAEGEEVSHFALAYVLDGTMDVAATMVDAPALRLTKGQVLRSRGTTNEGVPMRLICATSAGRVATWSPHDVEEAFRSIPWVEDDLRLASDRAMTLVGITIGPLGERLDVSIREEIVGKLTMRPLDPHQVIVAAGDAVPGLFLVGVGELELVKDDTVVGKVGSGDFLFATEVLGAGPAPTTARAGAGGALILYGDLRVAQELLVTCPPLLEVFAGM